jgi:hypothetical protein
MGRANYILKMFICHNYFEQSKDEIAAVKSMTFFIIYIYFFYWFKCTNLEDVPSLTLKLHHDLKRWEEMDKVGARAAIRKLDLHVDYLSGRNVIFSLASKDVSDEEKGEMAKTLLSYSKVELDLGKPTIPNVYEDSRLRDFINEESWHFFAVCNIDPSFLSVHPSEWHQDENYVRFSSIVRGLSPVNDAGERAVKLGTDFHGSLANDPVQHQAVLQNVEAHRRIYPKPRKFDNE